MVPLDDFGTLKITGASATKDGTALDLNALSAKAITMINSARQALAIPSVIAADAASFTVTRTNNQNRGGGVPGTGRPRRG